MSVTVSNPANVTEVAQEDADEIDPADLAPLTSGSAPVVNAPVSEDGEPAENEVEDKDEDVLGDLIKEMQASLGNIDGLEEYIRDLMPSLQGGASTQQPPMDWGINVWDSGKAWEREYHLCPEASRDELNTRLYNQVWDILQMMNEHMDRQTWN